MVGAGLRSAAQHSQSLYPLFTHIPGLKCVVFSSPYDAKGLLIQAIRDNHPVIFFEHKFLYALPSFRKNRFTFPFGRRTAFAKATTLRSWHWGGWFTSLRKPRSCWRKRESTCEILDLRTTSPMDEETILESVEKTGRLVVVDEASPRCHIATDVSPLVAQKKFRSLKAPIQMVTPPHTPVPFSDGGGAGLSPILRRLLPLFGMSSGPRHE